MSRLNQQDKYFGTYVNSQKQPVKAYLKFDATKNGFILRSVANDKPLIPTAFKNMKELQASYQFISEAKPKIAAPLPQTEPEPVAA